MGDLIDRQAAMDAFKKACTIDEVDRNGIKHGEIRTALTFEGIMKVLNNLPSAQPEVLACGEGELSAQPEQAVQEILNYLDTELHPLVSPEHWNVYSELHDMISTLPSAQPEIKPIDYQDCANAMLRMWMDKVVTDGEYNCIMDKLNAFWGARNERSN